jgi:high-affinity Fe2+/Pb2+ permease
MHVRRQIRGRSGGALAGVACAGGVPSRLAARGEMVVSGGGFGLVTALALLLIVAALATAGAWIFELKHERKWKDMHDGTHADTQADANS